MAIQPRPPRSSNWGGLKQTIGDAHDAVVKRAQRVEIRGVSLLVQKHHLVLDAEAGERVACRINDVSNTGYRLSLPPGRELPEAVQVGGQYVLEIEKQDNWLVEVRWVKKSQCGVRKIQKA